MLSERQQGRSSHTTNTADAARELIAELLQPLTAASNYVGTAREILHSSDHHLYGMAIHLLDEAENQILAAGKIAGRFHNCLKAE